MEITQEYYRYQLDDGRWAIVDGFDSSIMAISDSERKAIEILNALYFKYRIETVVHNSGSY